MQLDNALIPFAVRFLKNGLSYAPVVYHILIWATGWTSTASGYVLYDGPDLEPRYLTYGLHLIALFVYFMNVFLSNYTMTAIYVTIYLTMFFCEKFVRCKKKLIVYCTPAFFYLLVPAISVTLCVILNYENMMQQLQQNSQEVFLFVCVFGVELWFQCCTCSGFSLSDGAKMQGWHTLLLDQVVCRPYDDNSLNTIGRVKKPEYRSISIRLKSYRNWPLMETVFPGELASAGFFYTGTNDYVECFCCGLGVRQWMRGDDPFKEHAKLYSNCTYLESIKGRDFVRSFSRPSLQ